MCNNTGVSLNQGLQTTAGRPKDISFDSQRHIVNNEKIMYLKIIYSFRRM